MKPESLDVRKIPTYCYQCVAGPDLLTVKVEQGVATEVEPNFCAAAVHPGGGKVCVKPYGLVQKTYNPHRVLTPMKRSNPKKGRDQDPGFVPITWDEAYELIGAHRVELGADQLVGLVPGDWHKAGILVASFLRVAALHRCQHPMRVVGLLYQAVGLDADLAATRVDGGRAEVGLDLSGYALFHFHREQVRPGDALVTVGRDLAHVQGFRLHLSAMKVHLAHCGTRMQ